MTGTEPADSTRWWTDPQAGDPQSGHDPFSHAEPLGAGFDTEGRRCLELCPICRGVELLRAGGAPELRGQFDDFGREALLTLRAMIDHYLERQEPGPARTGRVEEIPIDP